jgi:hypothetical protein
MVLARPADRQQKSTKETEWGAAARRVIERRQRC